jgi:hypothetical protein
MIVYNQSEYEKYLNEVVKIENEDGFGTYIKKNFETVFTSMWGNLVQFAPSINKCFIQEKIKEIELNEELKKLKKYLSEFSKVECPIEKAESVEIATRYNLLKEPEKCNELVNSHTSDVKCAIKTRFEKQCFVRVMLEITNNDDFTIGLYTRLLFL